MTTTSEPEGAESYEPTPATQETKRPTRTPFYEANHAPRYARQALIREIEKETGATLICYVADDDQQVDRFDTLSVVDLLHNIPPGTAIDVLLQSPGGDIDAAEKLIMLVRKKVGNAHLRVIVPDYAKSAGTLIALGADEVVMSDTSELGAIDPQVLLPDSNGHNSLLSAQSYLDAYATHSARLREEPHDPVARLMLSKMEPATVRKLERMTTRSKSIAADLLFQGMLRNKAAAEQAAKDLSDTQKWQSHGQMISHESAAGLGLTVAYLRPEDSLWVKIWRLYCLQKFEVVGGKKLFESAYASLEIV
ncbi:hypothetical protein [Frondihabitans sp. PhB188]|uniref:SDH family Clp fold serine proteinase n=1 Tax=Frondihabitans sp. PhB188 TaxID=2485200 RepID=UPI00131562D9|nr:hypothetical protein [Frondihabitans sp. PhB188]